LSSIPLLEGVEVGEGKGDEGEMVTRTREVEDEGARGWRGQ
jgi:hypothetical protein